MRKVAIINGSLYFSAVNTAMPEVATWIRLGVLLELLCSAVAGAATLTLEAVVSPVFDRIANTFVESFVKRAEQVHGPR